LPGGALENTRHEIHLAMNTTAIRGARGHPLRGGLRGPAPGRWRAGLAAATVAAMLSLLGGGACNLVRAAPTNAIDATVDVTVEVSGVRSERGRLLIALHDTRSAFPSRWERAVVSAAHPAAPGTAAVGLRLPRPGRFALIVVHDEDGDGRMTKNAIGLPREGYATGRTVQNLELPRFERAQLDWGAGTHVQVRLLYP
jgi:uncharacterized protein (DUF2141 family)